MEFVRERAPVVFRWLVFAIGIASALAVPVVVYLQVFRTFDLPVILAGFALLLLGASFLLDIIYRNLPRSMILDARKGQLEIVVEDGRSFLLGFGEIRGVGLRVRGRGRQVVTLLRANGSFWDLLRAGRRAVADDLARRVQSLLAAARRKENQYPELDPARFRLQEVEDGQTEISWDDPITRRALVWIAAVLAGLVLMGTGALLRAGVAPLISWSIAGVISFAVAAYVLYSAFSTGYAVRIGPHGLRSGVGAGAAFRERQHRRPAQIAGLLYSFDMFGGLPQLLLPDAELLPRISGQLSAGSAGKISRIAADLRAGLRVFRLTLYGLSAGDALALEYYLSRQLSKLRD